MRIRDYVVRPDTHCWVVATIKRRLMGAREGEEYETDLAYPGRFPQALKTLLDRMVRDGLEPDASIEQAVATVAHLYATIGTLCSEERCETKRSDSSGI